MKNLETFPVSKKGKFFGYADADQIAASNGVLEIFDEAKAKKQKADASVAEAKDAADKKAAAVETAKTNGADPAAIKKAPSK
jgi:hypothetical protein